MIRILYLPEGRVTIRLEGSFENNKWIAVAGQPIGTVVKLGYAVSGFFTIHRASSANSYKFSFCSIDGSSCSNVGLVSDDAGNRLLAIDRDSFEFVLRPYESDASK
ncbi:Kunitz inhibitor ST1-like [Vigna unguiculata]|uniref:Kunitz inhibitor ST1-like n=1 Tax=Vigna unguiculata TaxID=3917 RepID=A0A4D6NDR6_VIGUN|nr:Kunitz inhibitor ST1-like [Vigna unguiculata]